MVFAVVLPYILQMQTCVNLNMNNVNEKHARVNIQKVVLHFKSNFYYITTITKQLHTTININHARWHICLRSCCLLVEETSGNPPAWLGDDMTISHATRGIEPESQLWVRGDRFTTAPVGLIKHLHLLFRIGYNWTNEVKRCDDNGDINGLWFMFYVLKLTKCISYHWAQHYQRCNTSV